MVTAAVEVVAALEELVAITLETLVAALEELV
jgi:hypothetical protein